jgi:hypothetical protein
LGAALEGRIEEICGERDEEVIRATVAKEVGMGNPAEENDPPPESSLLMARNTKSVNPAFASRIGQP